jgi:hypothetical protein
MTPREIIAEAWAITLKEASLRRWGFTTSLLETLLNVKMLGYQLYFAYAYAAGKEVGFFDDFIWLFENLPMGWALGITVAFLLLLVAEFMVPHICEGAIIGLAAKSHRREPVRGGLVMGLHNFWPLLAVHEVFVLNGWAMAVSAVSLILRYVDGSVKYAAVIGVVAIFLVSNTLKLFAGFAEEAVVIRKASLGAGIAQSYKLLLSHTTQIIFILLLLMVISIRIVVNTLVILLIPSLIIALSFLLALFLSPFVSWLIAGIVGLGMIVVASYYFAYIQVFKQTVWTLTYLELSGKKDIDVIIEE